MCVGVGGDRTHAVRPQGSRVCPDNVGHDHSATVSIILNILYFIDQVIGILINKDKNTTLLSSVHVKYE